MTSQNGLTGLADYGLVLEAAPDDPSIVIAGEGEIFHSKDFGSHLTKILDWLRYDAGDKQGFLQATVELALKRHDLGAEFLAYLKGLKL
jgi:hypothetical protein